MCVAAGAGKFSILCILILVHIPRGIQLQALLDLILGSLRNCLHVHSMVLDNDVVLRNFYILDSHRLLLVHSQVPMNVAFNFGN